MQIKNLLQLKRFFKSKDVLQSTALRLAISHNKGLDCPEDFKLMWFSVSLKSQKLLVAVVYTPPNEDTEDTGPIRWGDVASHTPAVRFIIAPDPPSARERHLFKTVKENNTQENIDKFAEARKRYSLSSKQWWRLVNTITEKSAGSDIPVLKDGLLVCTSAKAKVEKLGQTLHPKVNCSMQRILLLKWK